MRRRRRGEGQIGEPLGRDRPGRMVPARLAGEAPGVDHQQIGQQGLPAEDAGIDRHACRRRRQSQGHDAEQGEQVQRIDPRDARPQEASVAEPLLAEGLQIDVAEDEARQDEEQFDAEITLGRQGGHAADRQVRPHQIDHDPQGREEPERGQGTDVDRRRYGRHGTILAGEPTGDSPAALRGSVQARRQLDLILRGRSRPRARWRRRRRRSRSGSRRRSRPWRSGDRCGRSCRPSSRSPSG